MKKSQRKKRSKLSRQNDNDEIRINVDDISNEQITQLSDWCKNNEISVDQLTPRTTYAMKCLGFELQDVSSYSHEWKHQPSNPTESDAINPSNTEQIIKKASYKVEQYMYWFYLSKNIKLFQVMRAKIIEDDLINSDKKNEEKLDKEMMDKIVTKSNHEFDIFIEHNKKLLNQLFNEQKLALMNNAKRREQELKEKEKKQRKENERKQKELEIHLRREREKLKSMLILKQKEEEERKRSIASFKWMQQNKKLIQKRRSEELKSKQLIQKKRLSETEQYTKKQKNMATRELRESITKQKFIINDKDHHCNLAKEAKSGKASYFKSKTEERRKRHEQNMAKQKELELKKQKKFQQKLVEKEKRRKEFRRSQSEALLQRSKLKAKHRNDVIQHNNDAQAEQIRDMLARQKEAEKRREQYQLERKREAAMKKTMYSIKKNETIERMKRIQRAKDHRNERLSEKMKLADERYNKQKNLQAAILRYKLKSNDAFKEERQKQLDLSEIAVRRQDVNKLNGLIENIETQRFGIEKLNVSKLNTMTKNEISGANTERAPRSSTALFTDKQIQKVKCDSMR